MQTKLAIVYTIAPLGEPSWKRAESLAAARIYLELQIEQSLQLGWKREDVLIITNFEQLPQAKIGCYHNLGTEYFRGHTGGCLSKHIGALWAMRQYPKSIIWLRDHDCWQLKPVDPLTILGDFSFVVSGGKPPRISDQSCFLAPAWQSWLERFIEEHVQQPCNEGFGFKLGAWLQQVDAPARIVPYREVTWRFNMVSPSWRKELAAMPGAPQVCHQRLAAPEVVEFLAGNKHWNFLHLYAAASVKLLKLQQSQEPLL